MNKLELTKEQIAKRLAYLWHMRESFINEYLEQKLDHEKQLIYNCYGSDNEACSKSNKYYYETFGAEFERIIKEGSLYRFE